MKHGVWTESSSPRFLPLETLWESDISGRVPSKCQVAAGGSEHHFARPQCADQLVCVSLLHLIPFTGLKGHLMGKVDVSVTFFSQGWQKVAVLAIVIFGWSVLTEPGACAPVSSCKPPDLNPSPILKPYVWAANTTTNVGLLLLKLRTGPSQTWNLNFCHFTACRSI